MSDTLPSILVVDDAPANLVAMRALLARVDANIYEANSGNKALALCMRHDFSVILLDVLMPEMSGYEVAEFLRGTPQTRNIPIIFVTAAHTDEQHKLKGYDIGAVDYILKPVDDRVLLSKVNVFLDLYNKKQSLEREITERRRMEEQLKKNHMVLDSVSRMQTKFIRERDAHELFDALLLDILTLTDSSYGFVCDLHHDPDTGAPFLQTLAFSNLSWEAESLRYYVENAKEGLQFRNLDNLIGSAITSGSAVISNDPANDPRSGGLPAGHPVIYSYMGVPLWASGNEIVGLIGLANRPGGYDESLIAHMKPVLAASAQIIDGYHNRKARTIAEERLKVATKEALLASQAKSEFLAAMSHDIRTPMNAILGMGEVLRDSGLNNEQQQALQVLTHAGENLLALINDILDLSKVEAGQLQLENIPFELCEIVAGSQRILMQKAQDKGLEFKLLMQPACPRMVIGDPQRLRQILLNIMGNAIKFTESGKITIMVMLKTKELVEFAVSDTGIGIAKSQIDKIFDPFRQAESSTSRRFGGTGLGLSICSRLVAAMGGEIAVESEEGKGSTFRFSIPFPPAGHHYSDTAAVARPILESKAAASDVNVQPLDILLVDDAEDNRMVIIAFLQADGHRITEAVDGAVALETFTTGKFDLVLMDIQMPVMDGFLATEKIRSWERENGRAPTPIIALTANVMGEDVAKTIKVGCDMHIPKPVSKSRLTKAIVNLVNPNRSEAAVQIDAVNEDADSLADPQPEVGKALNIKALEQFRQDMDGNINPVLQKFMEKLPNRIENLTRTYREKDYATLSRTAHTLKGAAAMFGADRLSDLARQMEMQGKSGELPDNDDLLHAIMAESESVRVEIMEIIGG